MQHAVLDLTRLWRHVESQFLLGPYSIHGPSHWRRVEGNGLMLARDGSGADVTIVRLFAVLHDSRRHDEGTDWGHGERGAELARLLRGKYFDLSDAELGTLGAACAGHEKGGVTDHPTIGTCWDADRLDLGRVGARPDPRYMSTDAGRRAAQGWR